MFVYVIDLLYCAVKACVQLHLWGVGVWLLSLPTWRKYKMICLRPAVFHNIIIHLYRTTHSNRCMKYTKYTLRYQVSKSYYFKIKNNKIKIMWF
jgi:hypothetical protein